MKKELYNKIENFMLENSKESAHNEQHIYRVLYNALDIAQYEKNKNVDFDILITACLLHDIGRAEELKNKSIDHAECGSRLAYNWLNKNGFDEKFSKKVADCIKTHRYRGDNVPESIEAKILFDADKLDVAGLIGISRTLMYKGLKNQPLYTVKNNKVQNSAEGDESFFKEYLYKLSNIYDRFFTQRAKEVSYKMKIEAEHFYNTLYGEINNQYINGNQNLLETLND